MSSKSQMSRPRKNEAASPTEEVRQVDPSRVRVASLGEEELSQQISAAQGLSGGGNGFAAELARNLSQAQDDELTLDQLLQPQGGEQGMGTQRDSFGRAIPAGWGRRMGSHRGVNVYDNVRSNIAVRSTYGLKYQCVEFVNRFAAKALGHSNMRGTGHARDYNSRRPGLTFIPNQPGPHLPQDGDILVFHGSTYGHVGVATNGGPGGVRMIHQNARNAFANLKVTGGPGRWRVAPWAGYTLVGWQRKGPVKPAQGGGGGGGQGTYTVQRGDTLSAIAGRTLGNANRFREIADLNGIRSPYVIRPGQVLQLPGGASSSGGNASAPASGGKTYTVQRGDSLWRIAQRQLGNGNRYMEIARLNSLRDPSSIRPGQVLRLP